MLNIDEINITLLSRRLDAVGVGSGGKSRKAWLKAASLCWLTHKNQESVASSALCVSIALAIATKALF
jgi:hypothetical protein